MASVFGYNTPGNMRVFYPEEAPQKTANKGSVMEFLYSNPETSIFAYIVDRANLVWLLDGPMFDSTVFVPLNSELEKLYSASFFKNIDQEMANRIVRYSILKTKIEYWLLATMNYAALVPYKSYDRIEMYNVGGQITLNDSVHVFDTDKVCTNGVVLFTNDLLLPYDYS